MSFSLPLQGLRVIEFGQYIAAPAAAQTLADLGASVVKIEPPGGDASRHAGWSADDCGPMFCAFNRGKQSVVLDLRNPADLAAARELSLSADIVLQNARPGVMEKFGLGAEQLRAVQPRLIYASVNGFGDAGADATRPGLDVAAQAESGIMALNGDAHADPTRVGFTVVDLMAARTLTTAVLAALVQRGISGNGAHIRISLIDVAMDMLAHPWAEYQLTAEAPSRCGNGQATMAPAADVLDTGEGKLVISAYVQDHFARLCHCLDRPDMPSDPRFCDNAARVANRGALREALTEALAGMSADAACAKLTSAGVVCGVVRSVDGAVEYARTNMPERLVTATTPGGHELCFPALPISIDQMPRPGGALPALGEHTAMVIESLARACSKAA
ncbi:CoA transferase [Cupriavidus taiwanensis]|uniref:CaiB/BaiF CoA transferase family protein n=1 Tax=Cupriavidus taiwanensis TaxID=164546 RepID=UPI0015732C3A|nr:CoA transferase [Cupriavidus taiwanensis]NSX16799.1 CoA transferase [Cupriavidus taiwanensis]